MEEEEIANKDWSVYDEGSEMDYALEVDLDIGAEMHDRTSELPIAPEKMKIDESMLSPYARKILRELRGVEKHESTKLVSTLLPKKRYTVHAKCLALYISLGAVLKKVHRAVQWETSDFLRSFIDFCTLMREHTRWRLEAGELTCSYFFPNYFAGQNSKTDFRKRLFKVRRALLPTLKFVFTAFVQLFFTFSRRQSATAFLAR